MNAKQIEAYRYYKAMKPDALVVFHLPGSFVVLGDDVDRAAKSLSDITMTEDGVGSFPDDALSLSDLGAEVTDICLVECRNEAGRLDFPDVALMEKECEMDY